MIVLQASWGEGTSPQGSTPIEQLLYTTDLPRNADLQIVIQSFFMGFQPATQPIDARFQQQELLIFSHGLDPDFVLYFDGVIDFPNYRCVSIPKAR